MSFFHLSPPPHPSLLSLNLTMEDNFLLAGFQSSTNSSPSEQKPVVSGRVVRSQALTDRGRDKCRWKTRLMTKCLACKGLSITQWQWYFSTILDDHSTGASCAIWLFTLAFKKKIGIHWKYLNNYQFIRMQKYIKGPTAEDDPCVTARWREEILVTSCPIIRIDVSIWYLWNTKARCTW